MHDLETCDRVVYDNLIQFMKEGGRSDFIVGHLLGMDHVGHSTGSITDRMMGVKIEEFSRFLGETF